MTASRLCDGEAVKFGRSDTPKPLPMLALKVAWAILMMSVSSFFFHDTATTETAHWPPALDDVVSLVGRSE